MKAFTTCLPLLLALLPLSAGCGSLKRAGKDLAVIATSPATIPLRGVYDALAWENYAEYPATPVFLSPIAIPLHVAKHAGYTAIHVLDLAFSPLYLLASIDPDNDLDPINLYTLTEGFPWEDKPFPIFEDVHQDGGHRSVAPADD